ncbi:hypothetical protein F5887DRAFT_1075708 [Amanita rubescens]|nr:hypothetical protein F5887DRAFT_1075708 [Amanita rubescens]
MSDSKVTNDGSISSRAKNMARLGEKRRVTETPNAMVIELLDDESDTIASRVKDKVRLRKKRREKETPRAMVIESDEDSDSIASRVKDMARLRGKQRKKEAHSAMVTELDDDSNSTTTEKSPVDEMSSDSEERRPWVKKEEGGGRRQGFNRSPSAQCEECRRKGLKCTPRKILGRETPCQPCADRKRGCSLYQRPKRKGAKTHVKNKNSAAETSDSAQNDRSLRGSAEMRSSLQTKEAEFAELLAPLLTDDTIMEKIIKAHEAQKEWNRSLQDIGRDCVRRTREMKRC